MGVTICEYCREHVVPKRPVRVSQMNPALFPKDPDISIAALVESAETCPSCAALLRGFRHYFAHLFPRYKSEFPHSAKLRIYRSSNVSYEELSLMDHGITFMKMAMETDESMGTSNTIVALGFLIKRDHFRWNGRLFFSSSKSRPVSNLLILMQASDFVAWNSRRSETPIKLDGLTKRKIWQLFAPGDDILDERFSTIQAWNQECQKNHPRCRLVRKVNLPTRLVKVDSGPEAPRLVDSELLGDPTAVSYTALSHCWGTRPQFFYKTTRDNQATHRSRIPWEDLPTTYQEAITATRKLGIPYIWIDSLCIIQGDLDDWRRESSRMASVFSGAALTLAATDSEDGNGGLFFSSLDPPTETTYDEGGAPILLRCPAADERLIHVSPLNSRAWTLQELVLSRRTIHFSKKQLDWQCKELFLSEDGLIQNDVFASFRQDYMHSQLDFSDTDVALSYWWMWVKDYSTRKITVRVDWVPAIAGITEYFSEETGLTPILGLWKESLVDDLAWAVDRTSSYSDANDSDTKTQDTTRRSAILNIPSWTWLRYETPIRKIRTTGILLESHAKIQDAEVRWMETPLTSQIKSTKLTISAPLKRLAFCRASPTGDYPNGYLMLSGQREPEYPSHSGASAPHSYSPDDYLDLGRREPFTELCMKLLTREQGFSTRDSEPDLDSDGEPVLDSDGEPDWANYKTVWNRLGLFIAVREVPTEFEETPKRYERIGIGRWDASRGEPDPFEGVECSMLELV